MATLFVNNNRQYGINAIKFDLILSEGHSWANEVTAYNIEDGSVISDHIRNNPEEGTITGLISNYSLKDGVYSSKVQQTYNELKRIWKSQTTVDIVTMLEVYKNVAITNVDVPKDTQGEYIEITISFQPVKKVTLKQTTIIASVKLNDMDSDLNRQSALNLDVGKTVAR